MTQRFEQDFVVLGAGLCGLAAGHLLGDRALMLERSRVPGGLVRSECNNGYWFDHVLHLLYFADPKTEARITALLGDRLQRVKPEAWVETPAGTVRFPFQMHLGGLDREVVVRCLADLARETFAPAGPAPENFEQLLLRTFGQTMVDTFLLPYNRKMWRRPLAELAPSGFQWNITRPDFDKVLRGALNPDSEFRAYNAQGWYPRPAKDATLRGMAVLSAALAGEAHDLRLNHTVESIDLARRTVVAHGPQGLAEFGWKQGCLSTLPLPVAIGMCPQAPEELQAAAHSLTRNRVITVAFSVEGPRPEGRGFWRYYGDESLLFTRLIYLHEFDPDIAPPEGWVLMVEVTQRAEDPLETRDELLDRIRRDVQTAGALPADCSIVDAHVLVIDPAYVVFTPENAKIVHALRNFLARGGVTPLGRYGQWEYSSMAQVMRDGYAWAEAVMAPQAAADPSDA